MKQLSHPLTTIVSDFVNCFTYYSTVYPNLNGCTSLLVKTDSYYQFVSSSESSDVTACSYSYALPWVSVAVDYGSSSSSESTKTHIIAIMRIERYYNSIKDEASELIADAATLLSNQDYVGFFKVCGPTYVRSIRRAQEVTAILESETSSEESARSYAVDVQYSSSYGYNYGGSNNFKTENNSLHIKIFGYGLGLAEEGSEALVASSLEEFNGVMKFAWSTMVSGPNAGQMGMVYGIEVVSWMENIQFQLNSGADAESIEVPIIRSMIPKAHLRADPNDTTFDNNNRDLSKCKNPGLEIDQYGYCCEIGQLYDPESGLFDGENAESRICKPRRQLDQFMIKENMAGNGEFVARLDRALRNKTNRLMALEKCVSAINAMPTRNDYSILKAKVQIGDGNSTMVNNVTVYEMRKAMDPYGDYGTIKSTAKELDEFIDMFYQPCMAAIYGSNVGNSPNTDVKYFMAYPWHSHQECSHLSCFANGMRWDRDAADGGCVPGVLAGVSAAAYGAESGNCKKETNPVTGDLECKHANTGLSDDQVKTTNCLGGISSVGRIDTFLDNYCLPELTGDELDAEAISALRTASEIHCTTTTTTERSVNVALRKRTKQRSTYPRGDSRKAVDGKTDGKWYRMGVTHTRRGTSSNPAWWYVELGQYEDIQRIVIFNREDCCWDRLSGFTLKIFKDSVVVCTYTHTDPIVRRESVEIVIANVAECSGDVIEGDKVQIEVADFLQLAQVEVYNRFYTTTTEPAL